MSEQERTFYALCLACWSLGFQIAMERFGMALAAPGDASATYPLMPFLGAPSEPEQHTVH